jgi:hypothetical protein
VYQPYGGGSFLCLWSLRTTARRPWGSVKTERTKGYVSGSPIMYFSLPCTWLSLVQGDESQRVRTGENGTRCWWALHVPSEVKSGATAAVHWGQALSRCLAEREHDAVAGRFTTMKRLADRRTKLLYGPIANFADREAVHSDARDRIVIAAESASARDQCKSAYSSPQASRFLDRLNGRCEVTAGSLLVRLRRFRHRRRPRDDDRS